MARNGLASELWAFMRQRKKWWLLPIVVVMVLVGATIVGSIATAWHGVVNPPRTGAVREWSYSDKAIQLEKGEEMGRFLLGSTVVLLFPDQYILLTPRWKPDLIVRMGEGIGISYPRTAETRI